MHNVKLILGFLVISHSLGYSQCIDKVFAFKPGETLTYNAVYNLGVIWIKAGTVEFNVSVSDEDKKCYSLISTAKSLESYDWMFKVRDTLQSVSDSINLLPKWHKHNTFEGGYEVNNYYRWDYLKTVIYSYTSNSKKEAALDTLKLPVCNRDLLSAIYLCRNFDFSKRKINEKIPINVIIDGANYDLYIRYLGKEVLKTSDKKLYRTIKFSILLVEGTIFKGGEDLFIWITDDMNRIPLLVEAKVLVGSIKAVFTGAVNLRNKESSYIGVVK